MFKFLAQWQQCKNAVAQQEQFTPPHYWLTWCFYKVLGKDCLCFDLNYSPEFPYGDENFPRICIEIIMQLLQPMTTTNEAASNNGDTVSQKCIVLQWFEKTEKRKKASQVKTKERRFFSAEDLKRFLQNYLSDYKDIIPSSYFEGYELADASFQQDAQVSYANDRTLYFQYRELSDQFFWAMSPQTEALTVIDKVEAICLQYERKISIQEVPFD